MKKLSTFFKFLATGSITMLLTACYGTQMMVMYGMPAATARSGSFKIIDADTGVAVPGIQVEYNDDSGVISTSDDSGIVHYNLHVIEGDPVALFMEDIDGAENGTYTNGETGTVPYITDTLDNDEETVDEIKITQLDS